jgi:Pyruvate/2-oxoacid:ferredoxin oxidoreductase delta subunit
MSNILRLADVMTHLESVSLAVAPERCVRVRNRNATCSRCTQACRNAAITIADNSLEIDYDRCSACGACATTCPTGALLIDTPSFSEQFETAKTMAGTNEGRVIIACSDYLKKNKHYDSAQVLKVPCLSCLDQAFFVGLALCGARITLVDGLCEQCPSRNGRTIFDQSLGDVEGLLGSWGVQTPVAFASNLPEETSRRRKPTSQNSDLGSSRRSFFSEVKSGAKAVAADAILEAAGNHVDENATPSPIERLRIPTGGTMSQYIPQRNEFILSFLDAMGKPAKKHIDSPSWGDLTIDAESCTSCGMCAVFCPTGALTKHDESGSYSLSFYAVDCVNCSLCVDLCRSHSITIESGGLLETLLNCKSIHIPLEKPKATSFGIPEKSKHR